VEVFLYSGRIIGLAMLKKSIILSSFLALVSCNSFVKNEVVKTDIKQPEPEIKMTEHEKLTSEAIEEAKFSGTQMVGSSDIKAPHHYQGRTYFLYGAEHLNLENYYFDIPVVYNDAVKKWINYFVNRGRGFFERYSARAGRYAPLMSKILGENGLPKDLIFLAMAESGFHSKAKSWAKAVGPWQFMPYTGKRYGLKIDWYVDERRDPVKATFAASRYLEKLYNDFESWELAAAAYNAGEGKMGRAIRRYKTENFWKIRRGRYLKSETKNYVPKIMALAIIGKNLKAFGFEDIDWHEPLDFDEIEVDGGSDLYRISAAMGIEFEEMQRLNPEILRWLTPPNVEKYTLRIPAGMKSKWASCCQYAKYYATDFQNYKIKGRITRLGDVAKKFKIKDVKVLTWLNDQYKSKNSRVKKGTIVKLPFRDGQSKRAPMYADLYEKPRKSVVRKRRYKKRIRLAQKRGRRIASPTKYYTVRKGDSLWSVAKKNGVSLDTLIVSNLSLIKKRQIRAGDKLIVR
jgi:membrane-bound lytic murein transglycosylase D